MPTEGWHCNLRRSAGKGRQKISVYNVPLFAISLSIRFESGLEQAPGPCDISTNGIYTPLRWFQSITVIEVRPLLSRGVTTLCWRLGQDVGWRTFLFSQSIINKYGMTICWLVRSALAETGSWRGVGRDVTGYENWTFYMYFFICIACSSLSYHFRTHQSVCLDR